VGFGAWKTIGSEVRSCLHVSDPSSLALAFSRINFQVLLPQKLLKRMLHLLSRRKENEGQPIPRGIVRVNDSSGLTLLEPAFSPSYAGAILAGTDRMCRDSVEQMDRFPGYA
jgi:hypothetical protein